MDFTVLTLFPELVQAFFSHGMIGRAIERGIISGRPIQIRDFTHDRHNSVDDRPYGGGSGMVMKPEPLSEAIAAARKLHPDSDVVLMSPQGSRFDQETAQDIAARHKGLIFVCGRYEGIDERVIQKEVDLELSIGDYVMTGGELASMVIIDTVARMVPGVLGCSESSQTDSFMDGRLEYAQYTRPETWEGDTVPDVLLSGNHERIRQWRRQSSLTRTFLKRPDLFETQPPTAGEREILGEWSRELAALAGKDANNE